MQRRITFKVKATGLRGYWIAVGHKDIRLDNRVGTILLEEGREHLLIYYMEGNAGGSLSIIGTRANGEPVVKVEDKIPDLRIDWSDQEQFELKVSP